MLCLCSCLSSSTSQMSPAQQGATYSPFSPASGVRMGGEQSARLCLSPPKVLCGMTPLFGRKSVCVQTISCSHRHKAKWQRTGVSGHLVSPTHSSITGKSYGPMLSSGYVPGSLHVLPLLSLARGGCNWHPQDGPLGGCSTCLCHPLSARARS